MPVSKDKRKSKKGQRRKANLAKAADGFEGGRVPNQFDGPPQAALAETTQTDVGSQEQTPEETAGSG